MNESLLVLLLNPEEHKQQFTRVTSVHPTFDRGVGWRSLHAQVPRRVPLVGEVPHLQVADGEPDDGSLVQLAGDGTWQRQHLGQFIKLKVLLPPPRSRCVP